MPSPDLADDAAQEALRLLGPDPGNWVASSPGIDHDVVVVGGGQCGLTIAFALRRAGIANVSVVEAADQAGAGGWLTRARMVTLRTPKTHSGPELGIPALSFRAWYEALHGESGWAVLGRIARTDWADYLAWFHRQIGVAVRYRTRLVEIEPAQDHLRLHLVHDGDTTVETTRTVVLANGVEGTGGPYLPPVFDTLSRQCYAHTGHLIGFDTLVDASIGILGAATSAFDAAATALEAGARNVHLFSYRSDPVIARTTGHTPHPAAQETYHLRSDRYRWESWVRAHSNGSSSPLDTVTRATAFPTFHLHLDAPWLDAHDHGGQVRVDAGDGSYVFDFVIAGTGYQYDPRTRPELRPIADDIALWPDRHEPATQHRSRLANYPYLGPGYEFLEKRPGSAPWLANIHTFTAAANPSFGRTVGDMASLRTGVPRLIQAITHDLYFADLSRAGPPSATATRESHRAAYAHAIWDGARPGLPSRPAQPTR